VTPVEAIPTDAEDGKPETRLKRLDDTTQDRLINWGYAVCDAALRKHLDAGLQPRPYPKSGV
jgi:NTE family protein